MFDIWGVTNTPTDPYVHLRGTLCISAFLVSSCVLSTVHPRTGSHTAHSLMTTTKRVIRIVHIVSHKLLAPFASPVLT
jgi:hypothetical protein